MRNIQAAKDQMSCVDSFTSLIPCKQTRLVDCCFQFGTTEPCHDPGDDFWIYVGYKGFAAQIMADDFDCILARRRGDPNTAVKPANANQGVRKIVDTVRSRENKDLKVLRCINTRLNGNILITVLVVLIIISEFV